VLFIHIGLPKTGTTLLQENVFDSWPNIHYINDLWFPYLILQEPDKKYLISNETLSGRAWNRDPRQPFDWLKERELILDGLFRLFPQATILVSFRKHADFIESLYAQYLHEGGTLTLEDFFRIDDSQGVIRLHELEFARTIEMIESRFGDRFFVFTFTQLMKNTRSLLTAMGNLFGEPPPVTSLSNLPPKNKSVGYWQSKLLRVLNEVDRKTGTNLKPTGLIALTNPYTKMLRIDPRSLCQDRLGRFYYRKIRLSDKCREEVDEFFAEDWEVVIEKSSSCLASFL